MIESWGSGCYSAVAEYYIYLLLLLALQSWRQRLLLCKRVKEKFVMDTSTSRADKQAQVGQVIFSPFLQIMWYKIKTVTLLFRLIRG